MSYPIVTNKTDVMLCLRVIGQLRGYRVGVVGATFKEARGFVWECGRYLPANEHTTVVMSSTNAEIRFHNGSIIKAIPHSECVRGNRFNEVWQINENVSERMMREVLLPMIRPYIGGGFAD